MFQFLLLSLLMSVCFTAAVGLLKLNNVSLMDALLIVLLIITGTIALRYAAAR